MKNKKRSGFWMLGSFLIIVMALMTYAVPAMADEEDSRVAGCQAVQVSPTDSLEMQQAICGAAESNPNSSCAMAGHGMCTAPKTNDMLPEGTNCICVSTDPVTTEPAVDPAGETVTP